MLPTLTSLYLANLNALRAIHAEEFEHLTSTDTYLESNRRQRDELELMLHTKHLTQLRRLQRKYEPIREPSLMRKRRAGKLHVWAI